MGNITDFSASIRRAPGSLGPLLPQEQSPWSGNPVWSAERRGVELLRSQGQLDECLASRWSAGSSMVIWQTGRSAG
jgi:hypothetical protein